MQFASLQKNLVVKTTVDLDLQKSAEDSVETHLRQFGSQFGVRDAAMIVIDHNGAVRAMVGGRDYAQSQFNRATKSKRQPGSSFKPYVYASAIENFGYDENTRVHAWEVSALSDLAEHGVREITRADSVDGQI